MSWRSTAFDMSALIQSYSGLYPTVTTPDPRSINSVSRPPVQWIRDQSGAVPSIATIATYPVSLIALIPDLETFGEFEILPEG